MTLARRTTKYDLFLNTFLITDSPFRVAEVYNPDHPDNSSRYLPEMYGSQRREFHAKFFVDPLERRSPQTIGAVYSTSTGDNEGRGHGKSMLMAEESRLANVDFGASTLQGFDITDEDVSKHPFIAAYCTFAEGMNVSLLAELSG